MNTARAVTALWIASAGARISPRPTPWLRAWLVSAVWFPAPTALAALAAFAVRMRARRRAGRAARRQAAADVDTLAELVLLGVGAGSSAPAAMERAASELAPPLRAEVAGSLRRSRVDGFAPALRATSGLGTPLYRVVARSVESGAAIAPPIEVFLDDRADRRNAEAVTAARRLSVQMLLPLALLILPGFLVLAAAPGLLDAARRLGL